MITRKKVFEVIRVITGIAIMVHGLLRIIFLTGYLDFMISNFYSLFPSETILTIVSVLFPFLEFFAGLLLVYKISFKNSIGLGLAISVIMSFFLLYAQMYIKLIYHFVVVLFLIYLYVTELSTKKDSFSFNYSEGKINSRRRNPFRLW